VRRWLARGVLCLSLLAIAALGAGALVLASRR
jgi:hypothetical protein